MIPYFQYNTILIGSLPIQVWGLFVSIGLVVAIILAYYLAKKYLLSREVILDIAIWSIVGGLIGARLFHVVFYEPAYYVINPIDVLKFWHGGASSLGGFLGAAAAVYLFARIRKFSLKEMLPYMDVAAVSLWLGWGIGRIGCFFIHDHPGKLTDFYLAVNFPAGTRHDLGLYGAALGLVLFLGYFLLFKKLAKWQWGAVTIFSFMDYAIARFFLDFLRANPDVRGGDVRYFYLTPAQWGMIVLFFSLLIIFVLLMKKRKKHLIKT